MIKVEDLRIGVSLKHTRLNLINLSPLIKCLYEIMMIVHGSVTFLVI